MESGESLIGTDGGVVKARDFRRKAENGGRWSVAEFDKFVGVPWEPYPGAKGGFELRSKVRLPTEHAEFTEIVRGKNECTRRRFRIKKDDLEKFGYTTGCPGCRAVNRGTTAANHTEECRSRIAEELEKVGDVRLERENERLFEYLEEEEKKKAGASTKEKENTEKKTGVSVPSASSSGPATAQQNVPRSRGGVPMATDSGVGVHENEEKSRRCRARSGRRHERQEEQDRERRAGRSSETSGN